MTRNATLWAGGPGNAYAAIAEHEPGGVDAHWWPMLGQSRCAVDERMLSSVHREANVLEVGCGVGNQLAVLRRLGLHRVCGADINAVALSRCWARGFPAVQSPADKLIFPDGAFDLVYTSALLIHIAPGALAAVQREIARVSRRWIYGYEYYAPELERRASTMGGAVPEGVPDFTFKAPFCDLYVKNVPGLAIVKRQRVEHVDGSGNADEAFLLEKRP